MSEKAPTIDQREIQRLVLEYQYLRQLLDTITQQIRLLNANRAELIKTKETLEAIKSTRKDTEALVPIGTGVHLYVTLHNVESVLVEIGHRYLMECDINKAEEYINKRIQEVDETLKKLQRDGANISKRLSEITPLLQRYLGGQGSQNVQ
ncbi:MAG: prefoldin subunit alpha [Thermoprotei archaeon]|nr:MAG: prefoldin subunit alpha [Thermoprotei archaeon]